MRFKEGQVYRFNKEVFGWGDYTIYITLSDVAGPEQPEEEEWVFVGVCEDGDLRFEPVNREYQGAYLEGWDFERLWDARQEESEGDLGD